jgi:hypothetical protein
VVLPLAIAAIVFALVLIPTRRLILRGWSTTTATAYVLVTWAFGIAVALYPAPSRWFIPILLVLYIWPFVTWSEGLARLFGTDREPPRPPIKNVTPPGDREP